MASTARTGGPHDSIKYPEVYRGLRRHGFTKEAAARISNSGPRGWAKGGRNSHKGLHTGKTNHPGRMAGKTR